MKALYRQADNNTIGFGVNSAYEQCPVLTNSNSTLLQAAKSFAARTNSPKSNNRTEDSRVFEESSRSKKNLMIWRIGKFR